jgi:chromosome partitioning protein
MIRLVVSNQRGGVAKTTTAIALASLLADQGKRVLLVDTDPQGSVHSMLGLKPTAEQDLYAAMVTKVVFQDCLIEARENLFVLCSTRRTAEAEGIISSHTARELTFLNFFAPIEEPYEAVILDVAPSISLLQTCAMMYARRVLVPAAMEPLSLQGAGASLYAADTLNELFRPADPVKVVGLLPVIVNKRLAITQTVMTALEHLSRSRQVQLLPGIRTDQAVVRASRDRAFLLDYDPSSKALEDYRTALEILLPALGEANGATPEQNVAGVA